MGEQRVVAVGDWRLFGVRADDFDQQRIVALGCWCNQLLWYDAAIQHGLQLITVVTCSALRVKGREECLGKVLIRHPQLVTSAARLDVDCHAFPLQMLRIEGAIYNESNWTRRTSLSVA